MYKDGKYTMGDYPESLILQIRIKYAHNLPGSGAKFWLLPNQPVSRVQLLGPQDCFPAQTMNQEQPIESPQIP